MKTFTWVGAKGNVIELEAEYKMELKNEILDADGWKIETGKKETIITANLVAKVDGKVIEECWNTSYWKIIDVNNGLKRIWGINKIGFTAETAIEVEKFLNEVIESAKTEEVKELEEVIAKANKQNSIPTYEEARKMERDYNNMYNEGGEGYVPHIVDIDEYNRALAIMNQ